METIKEVTGHLKADGHRYAILVARFNHFVVDQLVNGAIDALVRHGCDVRMVVWGSGCSVRVAACAAFGCSGLPSALPLGTGRTRRSRCRSPRSVQPRCSCAHSWRSSLALSRCHSFCSRSPTTWLGRGRGSEAAAGAEPRGWGWGWGWGLRLGLGLRLRSGLRVGLGLWLGL